MCLVVPPQFPDTGRQTKVVAFDAAAESNFGASVAISGDVAIVGAYLADAPDDEDCGSAYVYRLSDAGWSIEQKLVAPDPDSKANFGIAVAVDGDLAAIGSYLDDANGVNAGAAYLFARTDDGWVQAAKLLADDGVEQDRFGRSVAVSGGTVVVGAPLSNGEAGEDIGSAYVFRDTGAGWSQVATLTREDAEPEDHFGRVVAIDGDTAVVGAYWDDDIGGDSGSVYVFREIEDEWVLEAKLLASDPGIRDEFGHAVAIQGDTLVVGALWNDVFGDDSGAAYVFERDGSTWPEAVKLIPSDGAADDRFGVWVDVHESTILVGALLHDGLGADAGAAYLFRESDGAWQQTSKIEAFDGSPGDEFGSEVAISGDYALIGAPYDGDKGEGSGSAYFFSLECPGDCNADGFVNVLDFLCFRALITTGDPAADCNGDGSTDVLDCLCFHGLTEAGCP